MLLFTSFNYVSVRAIVYVFPFFHDREALPQSQMKAEPLTRTKQNKHRETLLMSSGKNKHQMLQDKYVDLVATGKI